MPKAVLIDLDDTITTFDLTSAPAWRESTEWFVNTYEPGFSVDELIAKIQETKKWYWGDPDRHKRGRENLVLARREVVMEALKRYAGYSYFGEVAAGVIPDGETACHALATVNPMCSQEEIGYSKPDPRIFEYALDKLQLQAEDVWMIGDNIRWDVGGPQAIGIAGVWINSKQVVLPENYEIVPDLHCDSLLEVAEVIRKI